MCCFIGKLSPVFLLSVSKRGLTLDSGIVFHKINVSLGNQKGVLESFSGIKMKLSEMMKILMFCSVRKTKGLHFEWLQIECKLK